MTCKVVCYEKTLEKCMDPPLIKSEIYGGPPILIHV